MRLLRSWNLRRQARPDGTFGSVVRLPILGFQARHDEEHSLSRWERRVEERRSWREQPDRPCQVTIHAKSFHQAQKQPSRAEEENSSIRFGSCPSRSVVVSRFSTPQSMYTSQPKVNRVAVPRFSDWVLPTTLAKIAGYSPRTQTPPLTSQYKCATRTLSSSMQFFRTWHALRWSQLTSATWLQLPHQHTCQDCTAPVCQS
ncbi:hypothetical protein HDK90DRAFT_272263 [Phyllosticta capitalensis]|uniref:Uncharacterized protein n=1 Tax=Phyllosticta capitalensis TaxID=121624 RepID=A0ABR1YMA3_9PEZI